MDDGIAPPSILSDLIWKRFSGAGFTGMSTKAGDLLTLNFRDCEVPGLAGSVPSRVFCALNYDCALNIKDSGTELLDQFNHNQI